ncbi:MAG: S1 family peptidase, partial [Verrucomicrobiota bacterium]
AEMYRRMSDEYKVDVEVSDIKILLDDNSELPAEIVLRDKDLDLAFIRPKTRPANPMPAVDLTASGTADVLDTVLTLNRLNKAASRAYAISSEHISAVIQKPRTFYIPDSSMSTTTLGSPAFLPDGKMLGVFVMRAVSSAGGGSAANLRQNLTSIILPAQDILKASQQVPTDKVETEKKAETKTTAELSGVKK